MRSRTGCLTCRARKLKCDETRPICNNCVKGTRECVPCPAIVFRHQQNASMNAGHGDDLSNFYGYRESFAKDSIWVEIPRELTFINITDPYGDPHGEGSAPVDAPVDTYQIEERHVEEEQNRYHSQAWQPPATNVQDFDTYGLQALSAVAASDDRAIHSRNDDASLDPRLHELVDDAASDREVALLLSFFAHGPGHWMDLFDPDGFFEHKLPSFVEAHPLLLYSAVAVAGRVLSMVNESVRQKFIGDAWSSLWQWSHRATEYYDKAVNLLRKTLEREDALSPVSSIPHDGLNWTEELVATTRMLCCYELWNASGSDWSRHLDGAKSLLDVAQEELTTQLTPPGSSAESTAQHRPWSKVRTAIFWSFVRLDMLNAYVGGKTTRLKTSDHKLWNMAGLGVDESGSLPPYSNVSLPTHMICNALIWLVMKIVNFNHKEAGRLAMDRQNRQAQEEREDLRQQLTEWEESLPSTFQPTMHEAYEQDGAKVTKIWFASHMQSSTMQWYHLAHLQLLYNTPEQGQMDAQSTALQTLDASDTIDSPSIRKRAQLLQGIEHAKAIIGIELATDDHAAIVHAVQPLYVAGQMLGIINSSLGDIYDELQGLRDLVLKLLRDVEHDTGLSSNYRVRHLVEQWALTA